MLASRKNEIQAKYQAIVQAMRVRGRILVAFSGGVDSGLVLKLARDAVGDDCLAVIADSPSLARRELEVAKAAASEVGAAVEIVPLLEMENENYVRNPSTRCYFCRSELGRTLNHLAASKGFATIADGANLSDLGDFRPGMKAMDENGFWHPLLEFGVDKGMVREMARWLGLSFHDKPSTPCLSSRVSYGEPITVEKLSMIEAGEDLLHGLGFRQVRVRFVGGSARIEVPKEDISRLTEEPTVRKVTQKLKQIGFRKVTIDPQGYRTRSMNQPR